MTPFKSIAGMASCAAALLLASCTVAGKVEQGRVIAYNPQTRQVTLIRESDQPASLDQGQLPPITVAAPEDPGEMGPVPAAGGLMRLDTRKDNIVIFDRASQSFRSIHYTPVEERHNIAKSPGPPVVDRARKTITLYAAKDHSLITFSASDDLLSLPASTWRAGDVVRYYYKDPAKALRLMNVTRTDLSKATG